MDGSSLGAPNAGNGLRRAEIFEDEKRRIIESCFVKQDTDGSLLESYITHIRIIEDAAYPSSPPPPNSNPDVKKPRLIIVAVRKSGRVRMHKARENVNGTFSIGKTWPLDDLTAVESFNGATPKNIEEEQRKQWAAGVGFIVSLGKPYYWQANTLKEKQFFIASLVKIYTKYTGGKAPELIGFDDREREQLLGGSSRPQPLSSQSQPSSAPVTAPAVVASLAQSRAPRQAASRDPLPRQQTQTSVSSDGSRLTPQAARPLVQNKREGSPNSSFDANSPGQQQNLRRVAGANQSQESFGRSDDNGSLPPRSRGGMNGTPNTSGKFQDRSVTPTSQRTMTPDNAGPPPSTDVPPVPAPLALPPERRRPPISAPTDRSYSRGRGSDENLIPAPLASPAMRRDDIKLPMRSVERLQSADTEPGATNGDVRATTAFGNLNDPKLVPSPSETDEQPLAAFSPPPMPPTPEPAVDERPGLGPMIRKKSRPEIAKAFLNAATAVSAFKPRAGGAAARIREQQNKSVDGPDGITGVVPAPSLVRGASTENARIAAPEPSIAEKLPEPAIVDPIPKVMITLPQSDGRKSVEGPVQEVRDGPVPEKAKTREVRRQKPASERMQKEFASLDIDPRILDGRGTEFITLLDEFGWVGDGVHMRNIDEMKDDIEREINKAQAGGWLNRLEEEDDRIEAIQRGLDLAIGECDEFDGLLTLYSVELGTLAEDVAYIEAQSQGLQVQAANQKLLQAELQSLLQTISISGEQMQSLKDASIESTRGLEQIEASLMMLFKAMVTIDPTLSISPSRTSEDGSLRSAKPGGFGDSELGNMRVLQEKKDTYRNESVKFLQRLKLFLQIKFSAAIDETRKALEQDSKLKRGGRTKLEPKNHDLARAVLWKYSPLMLFSREVNSLEWEELMKTYEGACKPVYNDEFKEAILAWKKIARKPTGDENEILFTSQIEKQTEGIATTARKLTVKRSQTLAKSLRSPLGDTGSRSNVDKIQDGRLNTYEVFGGVLEEMFQLVFMEQNFIVDFFHVSSLEVLDFPDVVTATPPELRRGADLRKPKPMDPNRDLGKKVVQSMEELYSFFPQDMQNLIDWAIQADPLQGVGILAALERKMGEVEETNQEFISRTLQKLHSRLSGLFNKFLDEQIRAIEDTRVRTDKRKGVTGFIRIFPSFSTALETMLASAEDLDIRETVNHAYGRINKAMFESLKVIARHNTGITTTGGGLTSTEDKAAMNTQILLIENMYHYVEEVDARNNPVLEEWKEKATAEMNEYLALYLNVVIRRPLAKQLSFIEKIEAQILELPPGSSPSSLTVQTSYTKDRFSKEVGSYDGKQIRKDIEALKKRVEKHFSDSDERTISQALLAKVISACEKQYFAIEDRVGAIVADVYEGGVTTEWSRADVIAAFKK